MRKRKFFNLSKCIQTSRVVVVKVVKANTHFNRSFEIEIVNS